MLFWMSLFALFIGPFAYPLLRRATRGLALLDGFLLVSVAGLVLLHLLPHSLHVAGGSAAIAALAGLLLPLIADRWWGSAKSSQKNGLGWLALLALAGLCCHALMDGLALALPSTDHSQKENGLLALAVLLHRLPFGLALAWLLIPRWGQRAAWSVIALVAAMTSLGYIAGNPLNRILPLHMMALFQAFITGSLLHVLFEHRSSEPEADEAPPYWSGLGALLGIGLLWMISSEHGGVHAHQAGASMGHAFMEIALESAPALLLAYLGASLMFAFLRPAAISWLGRGSALSQSARGMLFGLPLPICSCGVVPLYQSLVRAGAPATAGMAFLIATPELGLDAILLSFPLLGAKMTWLRLAAAAIAAVVVSLLVGRMMGTQSQEVPTAPKAEEAPQPLSQRLKSGLVYGFGENADHTMPWILAGLFLAALLQPLLPAQSLAKMPMMMQVPLAALIGMPIYVCASGSTPFVAILIAKGLSPGAAIAFLLTGPATNITTFGILSSLHNKRVATAFAVSMIAVSCLLGWSVDLFFQVPVTTVLGHHHHSPSTLQILSLGAIGLITLSTLLRNGPRFLLGQLIPAYAPPVNHHGHDHGHDHNHHDDHHGHKEEHEHEHKHEHDHHGHEHGHEHGHGHEHSHGHDHKEEDAHVEEAPIATKEASPCGKTSCGCNDSILQKI